MQTSEKIWLDGKLIPWDQATVHVAAHVVHFGSSAFKGIRANGPAACYLFLVRRGGLFTPPLAASTLAGITRRCVLTLAAELDLRVREEPISREMLYLADGLFFCGTAAEITPICWVDEIEIGSAKRGPITTRLASAFFDIVEGRAADRHGWLTPAGH